MERDPFNRSFGTKYHCKRTKQKIKPIVDDTHSSYPKSPLAWLKQRLKLIVANNPYYNPILPTAS